MSKTVVRHDLDASKIKIIEDHIVLDTEKGEVNIVIDDLIGCKVCEDCKDVKKMADISTSAVVSIVFIVRTEDTKEPIWRLGVVNVSGQEATAKELMDHIRGKISGLKRPKKVVVFLNPIGGKQTAKATFSNKIASLLRLADIGFELLVSERADHLVELATDCNLTGVDGMMVLGGDGTLGDVISALVKRNQGSDLSAIHKAANIMAIPIGIIPTGTANVMCYNTHGTRDILTAVLHVIKGGVVSRGLKGVYSEGRPVATACWSVAYGYFSDMMYYNDKMRWLRQLRVLVVIPWFCLFKAPRIFEIEATILVRNYDQTDEREDGNEGGNDIVTKEIKGRHAVVMTMNANMVDENGLLNNRVNLYDKEHFSSFCYRQCPRLGMLQQLGQLMKQNPEAFKKDFLDSFDTTEMKVRILQKESTENKEVPSPGKSKGKRPNESDESYLERVVNIDGEMYEFGGGEFTIKFYPDSVLYFHS